MLVPKIYSLLASFVLFPFLVFAQLDQTTEQQLDKLFQEYDNQPGVAVAISSKEKMIYKKTFGYANLDYDIKISPKASFELGALSMHFTAACVLILENKGQLSLDDPIQKYLPELPIYSEGNPTIRHLFHHTSGIRDYIIALDMTKNTFDLVFDKDQGLDFIINQKELGFKPGKEYEYSNSNYLLLNHIVSKVSGLSLNDFAQKEIFKPLGMNQTFFYEEAGKVIKNRAIGYEKEEEKEDFKQHHFYNFVSAGDGRLQTTLDDFIIWMQHFKHPKIGGPKFLNQLLQRGVDNDGDIMSYALGLEHGTSSGFNFFGHNGYWAGFSSFFLRFPFPDVSIVVFSNNSEISSPQKAFQIADILLDDQQPKELTRSLADKPTLQRTTAQLEKWTGDYIAYKTGYLRKILVKNDTLIYQVSENSERKLIPIGKGLFRVLGSDIYSIQFQQNANGQQEMQFIREGIPQYEYSVYQPNKPSSDYIQSLVGKYYAPALNITHELKIDNNELVVFANGKEYARFFPVMNTIFCSKSGHNGYLTFDKDANGLPFFIFNDYSMKKVKFRQRANPMN